MDRFCRNRLRNSNVFRHHSNNFGNFPAKSHPLDNTRLLLFSLSSPEGLTAPEVAMTPRDELQSHPKLSAFSVLLIPRKGQQNFRSRVTFFSLKNGQARSQTVGKKVPSKCWVAKSSEMEIKRKTSEA